MAWTEDIVATSTTTDATESNHYLSIKNCPNNSIPRVDFIKIITRIIFHISINIYYFLGNGKKMQFIMK